MKRTGIRTGLEEARRVAERSELFLRRTIDALVDHIAILDAQGRIVYVNRAWDEFARENAAPAIVAGLGAGANYLEVCAAAAAAGEPAAAEVGAAIRAALSGTAAEFNAEYPCHSPRERRWFIVRVSAFVTADARHAVVSHQNITARRLAEEAVSALNEELEARVRRRTQALERAREEVRSLNWRLLQAGEAERRRLGRELHDRVGQNLSALGIALQLIRDRLSPESSDLVAESMERAQAQLVATVADVRTVMAELRPPGLEEYGLLTALRNHAEVLGRQTGAAIAVHGEEPRPRPPVETEIALYRIAQEALANALKHARAARIDVRLERVDGALQLSVADDGIGFDPRRERAQASWGLVTMRERAEAAGAGFEVDSAPGRGTRVRARVGL